MNSRRAPVSQGRHVLFLSSQPEINHSGGDPYKKILGGGNNQVSTKNYIGPVSGV